MTDKQTEALKLALEALTHLQPTALTSFYTIGNRDKAVAAIREALAEQQTDWEAVAADQAMTIALLKAEQPAQQEPVAWMHMMIDNVVIGHRPADIDRHPERWTPLYKEASPCPTCEALARTVMLDQTSHDTPLPQRKPWVELDHDDIHALMNEFFYKGMQPSGVHFANFAKAIEAKLREKNT